MNSKLDIGATAQEAVKFMKRHDARKQGMNVDFPWYPWPSLTNFLHLDRLLSGEHRDLGRMIGDGTAVDIGAADGDVAFFMESMGVPMHVVDYPPTNYNSCRALHAVREALDSKVEILETDLDSQFRLPQARYEFAFFLGILYHLKNPFFVLEALAKASRYAVISTRIASHNLPSNRKHGDAGINAGRIELNTVPAAYLLAPDECSNDATNFWIFSDAGLKRLLHRCGWDVLDFMTVGAVGKSDPATPNGDERAFCLVKSRHF